MPEDAFEGGARIVATGSSDFPNQINKILNFISKFSCLGFLTFQNS